MAARQHDFTATEIKAGALVLISLVILVGFVAAIKGLRPRDKTARTYHATFADVGGLRTGADVAFGGVTVGRVIAIEPDQEDRTRIRVTAEVRGGVPVNHGSVASIGQVSLTTGKHLEISTGSADEPLHESGDELETRTGSGGLLDIPDLEGVTSRLEVVLDSAIALLGVGSDGSGAPREASEVVDLAEIFASAQRTLDESTATILGVDALIEENRAGIREIVASLIAIEEVTAELMEQVNAAVAENRPPLRQTVANLEQLTGDAGERLEGLVGTLEVTLQHLQHAGGNASGLLEDQRPTIEAILLDLKESARNLSEFSRTLAEQPQSLLRGKSPQGRQVEERR